MKPRYGRTLLLGAGYLGISASWATYGAFVPVFLVDKFQLGPAQVGFFMALDNIAALLIQPPVGAWSDRISTPLGRRIPFVVLGAPIAAGVFGLIPLAATLPLFLGSAITFLLSMAFWRSPFFALLPDLTPSQYRSQANGIINAIGVTGAMAAFFAGAQLYRLNPAYPFWAGAAVLLITAALLALFLREGGPAQAGRERQPGILRIVSDVLKDRDRSVLRIMLAILLVFTATNALDTFTTLYAINHLRLAAADGARLMGQMTVAFMLFAIPAGHLGARVGRRISICFGLLFMTVCAVVQFFLPVATLSGQVGRLPLLGDLRVVGLIAMLMGIGWSLVHTNTLPMVVDSTTANHAGSYVGLYYLFSTLGAIIGPVVNGWIIQLRNSDYNLMLLVSPAILLAAFGLMLGVQRGEAIQVKSPAVSSRSGDLQLK